MPRDAYESTCLTVLPTSFKVLHEAITTKDFTEPDDLADYLKTVKITEKFVLIVQGKNDHYSKFLPNLVKAAKHVKEFVVFCNIYSPGIIGKEVLVYLMTYLKECHT
uniref:Uncharacterized protein n=1 Tax=Panagrolaimus sp. JU765 TaxID=591449 RepID=A0AC34RBR2_9BILA